MLVVLHLAYVVVKIFCWGGQLVEAAVKFEPLYVFYQGLVMLLFI
jgi:hypothetical protein